MVGELPVGKVLVRKGCFWGETEPAEEIGQPFWPGAFRKEPGALTTFPRKFPFFYNFFWGRIIWGVWAKGGETPIPGSEFWGLQLLDPFPFSRE